MHRRRNGDDDFELQPPHGTNNDDDPQVKMQQQNAAANNNSQFLTQQFLVKLLVFMNCFWFLGFIFLFVSATHVLTTIAPSLQKSFDINAIIKEKAVVDAYSSVARLALRNLDRIWVVNSGQQQHVEQQQHQQLSHLSAQQIIVDVSGSKVCWFVVPFFGNFNF